MNRIILGVVVAVFLLLIAGVGSDNQGIVGSDRILLKSREFTPTQSMLVEEASELEALGTGDVHVLLQLDYIPSTQEKEELAKQGIVLLEYVPENAWLARIEASEAIEIASREEVRFLSQLEKEDKIAPAINDYGIGSWSYNPDGSVNLNIVLYPDIPRDEARNLLEMYGEVVDESKVTNTYLVKTQESQLNELVALDQVEWIDNGPPPKESFNDGSRTCIGVDIVQTAPYNLNGSGVVLSEWDAGWADPTHDDFAGRITTGDVDSTHYHSTHVAGTMMGDGNKSSGTYRGMAPNATLITYEWPDSFSELYSETNDSIKNGSILSQNSWGWAIGSGYGNCYMHGDYDSWTVEYDSIIDGYLDAYNYSIVFSAGNEENDGDCAPYPWNQTSGPGGTGKNAIMVGAVYSDTKYHTCFSSRGPTDDGRIKPDLMAAGDESACLSSPSIYSTYPGDTYINLPGTSMAAPAVSGTIALMVQRYRATHNNENMRPSTVKAILIHTAMDQSGDSQNDTPGPDYTYGWGLVNATTAIDYINNDTNGSEYILEANISNGGQNNYPITISGESELKVTLVWDDYQGTAGASKELVNDLDLLVYNSSGDRYYPWTLNASNPSANATQDKADTINNVEQVYVSSPTSGNWSIGVNGTSVPQAPEWYSLVSNEDMNSSVIDVTLVSPVNNYNTTNTSMEFNCSANSISANLTNITLYTNISGWAPNDTHNVGGTYNWSNWTMTGITNGTYVWNCLANNSNNTSSWATSNNTFTLDQVNPATTLDLPINYYNSSSTNVTFNCSATDNYGLSNITLYGNWSSWHANETKSLQGTNSYNTFTKTLSAGSYLWNCEANDTQNNADLADSNYTFTIDTTYPVVNWVNATPKTVNKTESINITANVTDDSAVSNVTVEIAGTNYSMSSSGDIYSYNWDSSGAVTRHYNYTVYANDTAGNTNTGIGNFTVAQEIYSNTTNITEDNTTIAIINSQIRIDVNLNDNVTNSTVNTSWFISDPNQTSGVSGKNDTDWYFEITTDSNTASNLSWSLVYFYYNDTYIHSKSINESTLEVYKYSGSAWSQVSNSSNRIRDTTNNYVRINLTSFSLYALFGSLNQTPSNGGNGGNGGGGGGGGGAALPYEILLFGNVEPGQTVIRAATKSDEHFISSIGITAENEIKNGMAKIIKYNSKPAGITDVSSGTLFTYLNLEKINFNEGDLEKATITFKINQSWLASQGLGKASLMRYVNGSWVEISSRKRYYDTSHDYYSTESSGFSYFAIVATEGEAVIEEETEVGPGIVTEEEGIVENITEEREVEEIYGIPFTIYMLLILLVAVILVGLYIIVYEETKKLKGI